MSGGNGAARDRAPSFSPTEPGPSRHRPLIVVLQHNGRDPLGTLWPALAPHSELLIALGPLDPGAGARLEELRASGEYDGVIALGGPMAVYERDVLPFLGNSMAFLEDALAREVPILGICLGGQMLSEVLGSRVFNGAERGLPQEVGFFPLHVEPGEEDDPVISLFAPEPVLFWHRDTHDLPPGTARLARTDLYDVAAFRVRDNVYGLQFHLETSPDILQVWASESPLLKEAGADGEAMLRQAYAQEEGIRFRGAALASLFLSWVEDYRACRRPAYSGPSA